MTHTEIKTIFLLAGIYMSRMLGLFLIFPTFSLLASDLPDATPTKIGLALGIYSLAQAVLQIPAGWLSDIIGRKKILFIGLVLFLLGSLLASFAKDLDTLILARLLQGMGAVSAVCLAYVGDTIRSSEQGKAMMIIGMAIGLSFMLAFVLGALISERWGLSGLFRTTALLATLAMIFAFLLPQPQQKLATFDAEKFKRTVVNKNLFSTNIQVALLHMTLSASFFLLPLLTKTSSDIAWLYTIPLFITAIVVSPLVRNRDKGITRLPYFWVIFSVGLLLIAITPLFDFPALFMAVMTIFFCGFTLIETLLPARLFQFSDETARGASSGVFSLYQFTGSFLGGLLGAKCYTLFETSGTIQSAFYVLAVPAVIVAVVSIFMNKQRN